MVCTTGSDVPFGIAPQALSRFAKLELDGVRAEEKFDPVTINELARAIAKEPTIRFIFKVWSL